MKKMEQDLMDKLKECLSAARTVAERKSRFLCPVINGLEIRLTDKVPIAAVSREGVLYINPERLVKATLPKQVVSALIHEALHIFLGHFKRLSGPNVVPEVANIAEDAVVNDELLRCGYRLNLLLYKEGKMVTMDTISKIIGEESSLTLWLKSEEEIYDLLTDKDVEFVRQKAESYGGWSDESMDTVLAKTGSSIEPQDSDKIGKQMAGEGNVFQKGNTGLYGKDPITGKREYDILAAFEKVKGAYYWPLPVGIKRIVDRLCARKR